MEDLSIQLLTEEVSFGHVLARLTRQGYGLAVQGNFIRVAPIQFSNVTHADYSELKEKGIYTLGQERDLLARRKKLEAYYVEEEQAVSSIYSQRQATQDAKEWSWGEETDDDKKLLADAMKQAETFETRRSSGKKLNFDHSTAWKRDLWELLKFDFTGAELQKLDNEIDDQLLKLSGAWSAMKYLPRTPAKTAKYSELKKHFAMCYGGKKLIEEELFSRDYERENGVDGLGQGDQRDSATRHMELDALRWKLHATESTRERISQENKKNAPASKEGLAQKKFSARAPHGKSKKTPRQVVAYLEELRAYAQTGGHKKSRAF